MVFSEFVFQICFSILSNGLVPIENQFLSKWDPEELGAIKGFGGNKERLKMVAWDVHKSDTIMNYKDTLEAHSLEM